MRIFPLEFGKSVKRIFLEYYVRLEKDTQKFLRELSFFMKTTPNQLTITRNKNETTSAYVLFNSIR